MQRVSLFLSAVMVCSFAFSDAWLQAADDFTPPPAAEREAVAALNKLGCRITIDGDYRVVTLSLSPACTNDSLKLLPALDKLTSLSISSTKIDDEGVNQIQALGQLTSLSLSSSGISQTGVEALRKGMPNCRITSFGRGGFGAANGGPGGRGVAFPPAGPGGFGASSPRISRPATLARNTAVQDDLKLTPEQRQQITEASSTAALTALMEAIDAKVIATLTDEQRARLKQLELQQTGILVLVREDIAKQLKLTEEQVAAIRTKNDEAADASRQVLSEAFAQRPDGGPNEEFTAKLRAKVAEVNKQREEKVLTVLTDEQKKAWAEMTGPKGPEVVTSFGGSSGGFGGRVETDPVAAAKSIFERYDADKDGKISDAEFPESNRTRQTMIRSGITLTFPIAREEFEKTYARFLDQMRGR